MGTPASRRGIRSRGREKGEGAAEKKKEALYACKAERGRGIMVGQGLGDGDRDAKTRQVLFGPSIPSESTQSCQCREIDSTPDFMRDSSMLPKAMLSFSRSIEIRVVTRRRGKRPEKAGTT